MDSNITGSLVDTSIVNTPVSSSGSGCSPASSSEITTFSFSENTLKINDLIIKQIPGITDDKRIICLLAKEIDNLRKEMLEIKNEKLIKELNLPNSVINDNPDLLFKDKPITKKGQGYKPLLESDILEAQSKTENDHEAAKLMGISRFTFDKWARKYGLLRRLKRGLRKGYKKGRTNSDRGMFPISGILNGKFDGQDIQTKVIRKKLIYSGLKMVCCELCGFKAQRADGEYPLLLVFLDNNKKNRKIENLKLYCYNCYFLYISELKTVRMKHNMFSNPGNLQKKMDD